MGKANEDDAMLNKDTLPQRLQDAIKDPRYKEVIQITEELLANVEEEKRIGGEVYDERITIFIDVLGWKEHINKSLTDPELRNRMIGFSRKLEGISLSCERISENYDIKATQFSDSIIISISPDDYHSIFISLRYIYICAMAYGFTLRGGVSKGTLYHEGSVVFGSALADSYKLESEVAIYPRIIFSQEICDSIEYSYPGNMDLFCKKSEDGFYHYNFLELGEIKAGPPDFKHKVLSYYRDIISKEIDEAATAAVANDKTMLKYLWMKEQFNSVCEDNPEVRINQIKTSNPL